MTGQLRLSVDARRENAEAVHLVREFSRYLSRTDRHYSPAEICEELATRIALRATRIEHRRFTVSGPGAMFHAFDGRDTGDRPTVCRVCGKIPADPVHGFGGGS